MNFKNFKFRKIRILNLWCNVDTHTRGGSVAYW